jgi:hypothetical protein
MSRGELGAALGAWLAAHTAAIVALALVVSRSRERIARLEEALRQAERRNGQAPR